MCFHINIFPKNTAMKPHIDCLCFHRYIFVRTITMITHVNYICFHRYVLLEESSLAEAENPFMPMRNVCVTYA